MKVSGKVREISSRDFPGINGKGYVTLWSFRVEGNNKYFRTGETKPNFRETDFVAFEADDKGKVSNLLVEVSRAPDSAQTPPSGGYKSAPREGGSTTKEGYWAEKEARDIEKDQRYHNVVEPRITYSSAQSDAVRLVAVALEHDLLSFGNANKSAKLGLLLDYVDQVTLRFAHNRLNAPEILASSTPEVSEVSGSADSSSNDD